MHYIRRTKRAKRRYQRRRNIDKFKRITAHWDSSHMSHEEEELWVKHMASRGSIGCGCAMCANPRRKHSIENGKITIQEKKNLIYYNNWEDEE